MEIWQTIFLLVFCFFSFIIFVTGYIKTSHQSGVFQLTPWLWIMGIFVWGDAVILGMFWLLVSIICLLFHDWLLFLLIVSLFWLIRSIGEMIYWFNQQFSTLKRNPPENLFGFSIFKNDSIWFAYQLFYQCLIVITLISSIYLAHLWLQTHL